MSEAPVTGATGSGGPGQHRRAIAVTPLPPDNQDPAPRPDPHRHQVNQAWSEEVRRRAAEIDSGAVKPIPWAEVDRKAQGRLDEP
jgi:hypothetical protein